MTATNPKHITSADGTSIGYLQEGSGPGIILLQGAGGLAEGYSDLARALSSTFTVYIPDRRGRGWSYKPFDPSHTVERDVEDIDALMRATGTTRVFGMSSGAVLALEAARSLPGIKHVCAFEPPYYPSSAPISKEGIQQLNDEIARGAYASAALTIMYTSQLVPRLIPWIPGVVSRPLIRAVMEVQALWAPERRSMKDVMIASRYDFSIVGRADIARAKEIKARALLISGDQSPEFLRESCRRLEGMIDGAQRIEFEGMWHNGPWNKSRGADPDAIARAIIDFMG
jgi:pimeloyl-ACP methyl ester carboxylesterase